MQSSAVEFLHSVNERAPLLDTQLSIPQPTINEGQVD